LRLALGDVLEVWNFRVNCDASSSYTTIPSRKHVPTRLILSIILACSTGTARSGSQRTAPCKTPANAKSCYWTHGRLSGYNGTPEFRIWKIGSHRLLGVYSGPSVDRRSLDNENPEFPLNVEEKFRPFKNRIFADFEVCPLEPEKPGAMQAVCVESAKNIVGRE
jgi:hypothetical protein